MLKPSIYSFLIVVAFLQPNISCAQEKWAHEIDFGMIVYKGNTDAKNFNGKLISDYKYNKLSNNIELSGLLSIGKNNTTQNRERNAEKYKLQEEVKYLFTPRHFSYLRAEGIRDHFSAYDYEVTESIGYGYRILDNKNVSLDVQGGPGGRHSRTQSPKNYSDEWIGHLETTMRYLFNPQTSFKQKLTSDASEKNVKTRATSELKTTIIEPLSVKLNLELENNSHLPENDNQRLYKTDTTTSISVSYTF